MINQKRILIVHGIFSKEGESNVWNMKAPLEKATGLPVVVFEYGYLHAIQARFGNPAIARRLADVMEQGDIIVNHSNGAAVTWLATHKWGARPSGVVMVQPALDEYRMPICDWAHVYYNREDSITWWSSLLIGNVWGDMGKIGYRSKGSPATLSPDKIVQRDGGGMHTTFIAQTDTIGDAKYLNIPPAKGHLAIFQSPCVQHWGSVIGRRILSEMQHAD